MKCDYCKKNIDSLPHQCRYCNKVHCKNHLLPENHDCKNIPKTNEFKYKEIIKPDGRN